MIITSIGYYNEEGTWYFIEQFNGYESNHNWNGEQLFGRFQKVDEPYKEIAISYEIAKAYIDEYKSLK